MGNRLNTEHLFFSYFFIALLATLTGGDSDVLYFSVTTKDSTKFTPNPDYAASDGTVYVTLWFNSKIYQHTIVMPRSATTYTVYQQQSPTYSRYCDESQDTHTNYAKMMIENNVDDTVVIEKVSFATSTTWYGIESFCIPPIYTNLLDAIRDDWSVDDSACNSNDLHHLNVFCIENDSHCSPYKQIVYFDLSKPNQYITAAAWSDGTNEPLDLVTCQPTQYPTSNPSEVHPVTTAATTAHVPFPITSTAITVVTDTTAKLTEEVLQISSSMYTSTDIATTMVKHSLLTTEDMEQYVTETVTKASVHKKREANLTVYYISGAVVIIALLSCAICVYITFGLFSKKKKENTNASNDTAFEIWFKNALQLPQYMDIFKENGYCTLNMIQQINSKAILEEMGIMMKGHQALIMHEIDILRDIHSKDDIVKLERKTDVVIVLSEEQPRNILVERDSNSDSEPDWIKLQKSVSMVVINKTRVQGIELQPDEFVVENEQEKETKH